MRATRRRPRPLLALAQNDKRDISSLAGGYADGIDAIGDGKTDAERWHQCFAEGVRFTLSSGTGQEALEIALYDSQALRNFMDIDALA